MISTAPAAQISAMAETALCDPVLVRVLCKEQQADIAREIERHPLFRGQFQAYLETFGDRCIEELKLESRTLHDDPLMLARSVGLLARRFKETGGTQAHTAGPDRRRKTERQVTLALRFHPVRRLVFRWILAQTRARIRDRENLRFERTRLFAHARRIFVE